MAVAATFVAVGMASPAEAVTTYSISGTLTGKPSPTAAPVPLSGVEVDVTEVGGNRASSYAFTDAAGHWSVSKVRDSSGNIATPLTAGTYTVLFNCSAANPPYSCNHNYVIEYLGHSTQASTSTKVALTSTAPTATANNELARGAAISGKVTTADGTPLARAGVSATSADGLSSNYTSTATDGTYTLDQLRTTDNLISASYSDYTHPDAQGFFTNYSTQWWDHAATQKAATPVTLLPATPKTNISFSLSVRPSVTGRVVDTAGNGVPDLNLTPMRFDVGTNQYVSPKSGPNLTNAQGYFRLFGGEGRGSYKLLISDDLRSSDDGTVPTRTPFETTWYRNATSLPNATVITVPTSGNTNLGNITVTPHTGAVRFIGNPVIQNSEFQDGSLEIAGVARTPGTASIKAQWYRNGALISGATNFYYVPAAADKGTVLTVKVTATLGSATATSTSAGYTAQ